MKYTFTLYELGGEDATFSYTHESLYRAIDGFESLMCSNIPDLWSIMEFWTSLDEVVEMLLADRKNEDGKFAVRSFDFSDPENAFVMELDLIGENYWVDKSIDPECK